MITKILTTDDNSINEAGKILKDGGLVAFPTETVYGLGANALYEDSVKKIYEAKGRPSDNPLIVHVCSKEAIYDVACNISDMAKKLIDAFMPGPFTIILNKKECIPYEVTAGLETVAIRYPKHNFKNLSF